MLEMTDEQAERREVHRGLDILEGTSRLGVDLAFLKARVLDADLCILEYQTGADSVLVSTHDGEFPVKLCKVSSAPCVPGISRKVAAARAARRAKDVARIRGGLIRQGWARGMAEPARQAGPEARLRDLEQEARNRAEAQKRRRLLSVKYAQPRGLRVPGPVQQGRRGEVHGVLPFSRGPEAIVVYGIR